MKNFYGKRCLLLVTGASRGLGSEIARALSEKLGGGSVVVLAATNSDLLQEKCREFAQKFPEISFRSFTSRNEDATFADYEELFDEHMKISPDAVVVVHNAGSLGNIDSPLCGQTDGEAIDRFLRANVRHPMLLSSAAISKSKAPLFLINISSLCGIKPMKGTGLYCTAKAARKMYFSCLAEENPGIRILQYSPGPLDTDMMDQLRKSALDDVVAIAKVVKESGTLLTVEQTTSKLCEIIEEGAYESGAHLDYFDR
ncbi:sepiapterin reductase [Galendromus occidentalis]|uniref:Sepiapterin reductase n=1 Tax=Galendromus occidentalis TaxID=34638 RepID=A0AAJ6VUX7_9ACAR|nr:sepiapterin reductase [Galendromus occidentalis]